MEGLFFFFLFWCFGGWGFLGLLLLVYVMFFEVAHSLVVGVFFVCLGSFQHLESDSLQTLIE